MERIKKLALRRIFSLRNVLYASDNREAKTLCLSNLPDDILVCILCYAATEPRNLVIFGQTCRRLHEISFADIPWIKLWHRLAERGSLPPIRLANYERPVDQREPCSQKTVFSQLPNWSCGVHSGDSRVHSTRSRMRRILEAQHRLHATKPRISAHQIAPSIFDCTPSSFVAMSMTAGGEALVIWTLSGLFILDLEYGTEFALHFAHDTETIERAQIPRMAAAMYRYKGSVGVLIAGKFNNSSTLSVLYQEIPQKGISKNVPNYIILLEIPRPTSELTSRIQITAGYLISITIITPYGYSEVHALSLSSEQIINVVHKDHRMIQAANIIGNKLFLGFSSGHAGEHRLEMASGDFTSSSYLLHSPSQTYWGHWHYMTSEPFNAHDCRSCSLSFARWSLQHSSPKRFVARLDSTYLGSDCPIHPASPTARPAVITLNSSHFAAIKPKLSSSNPPSPLTRMTSAFWGENQEFSHQRSLAGQSTLLSQLRATGIEADVFVLSHTPQAGSNGGRGPQPGLWVTHYKAVDLETQEGPKLFTSSTKQQESIRDFLWNEWTGQIVIASVNAASGTMSLGLYQI